MEPIEGSETSAFRTQTAGNCPKENILHKEHGEILKSRNVQIHGTATLTANIQPLACTEYEVGLWAVWEQKSIRQNARFQAFSVV